MKAKMLFPHRIPEPKLMGEIEQKAFEQLSKENYKRWLIPLIDDLLQHAKIREGKFFDVACGPGLLTKELAGRSQKFFVTGIDNSPEAIRLAKINCRGMNNVNFKLGSVYRLDFPEHYFDIVVCKDSMHHFDKPAQALKEMFRVLKNGGILYIQDLRRDLPIYLLKRAMPPDTVIKKLQYYSTRAAYTKSEIELFFKRLKWKNFSIKTRNITKRIENIYNKKGIDPVKMKEGFQSRYVAIVKSHI